jgi:hypothetical protein
MRTAALLDCHEIDVPHVSGKRQGSAADFSISWDTPGLKCRRESQIVSANQKR